MSKKWYNDGIEEKLIKDNESIPDGFVRGRIPKHKKIDDLKLIVDKETLYKDYIIKNISFVDLMESYNISRSDLRQLLNYYKIHKSQKNARKNNNYRRTHKQSIDIGKKSAKTQKENWNRKTIEEKQQWSNKCSEIQKNLNNEIKQKKVTAYKDYWNSLTDEEKSSINKKRSNSLKETWSDEDRKLEIITRQRETAKENRKDRLCRSVSEQKMFDMLITLFDDVSYDIRVDDRYPYFVDFYIKHNDLFIELNAHPSHGRLPFDYLNIEEYSNYPVKWADVYANRDVDKYNKAIEQKLNYIRIYPQATLEENYKINNNKNKELIKKLYQTQN